MWVLGERSFNKKGLWHIFYLCSETLPWNSLCGSKTPMEPTLWISMLCYLWTSQLLNFQNSPLVEFPLFDRNSSFVQVQAFLLQFALSTEHCNILVCDFFIKNTGCILETQIHTMNWSKLWNQLQKMWHSRSVGNFGCVMLHLEFQLCSLVHLHLFLKCSFV